MPNQKPPKDSPVSPETLSKLLVEIDNGRFIVFSGEGEDLECKQSFYPDGRNWLRTAAALSNNEGGYIVFGVSDADKSGKYVVCGMANDRFSETDNSVISHILRDCFDPTPRFKKAELSISGMKIGFLYIQQHVSRPIISRRNAKDEVREGEIYFRYNSESTRIKYSDLRILMDDRDLRIRDQISSMMDRIMKLGPELSWVADIGESQLIDGKTYIQIDDEIIRGLNFIKEGQFDEVEGAPAYKLVGHINREGVDQLSPLACPLPNDMILDMHNGVCRASPIGYLNHALNAPYGKWMPIFYYLERGGISLSEFEEIINHSDAHNSRKEDFLARISEPDYSLSPVGPTYLKYLESMRNGEIQYPSNNDDASHIAMAIMGCRNPDSDTLNAVVASAFNCLAISGTKGKSISNVRRAYARIDEIKYAHKFFTV